MATPFFKYFGQTWFQLSTGNNVLVNDVSKFVNIVRHYRNNPNLNISYTIEDGDSPDKISMRLYQTTDYWWTVLLVNDIDDYYTKWPTTEDNVINRTWQKYWGQEPTDIHHYEDVFGVPTDPVPYLLFDNQYGSINEVVEMLDMIPVTNLEYEHRQNEKLRDIVLVDPNQIPNLIRELREAFDGNR